MLESRHRSLSKSFFSSKAWRVYCDPSLMLLQLLKVTCLCAQRPTLNLPQHPCPFRYRHCLGAVVQFRHGRHRAKGARCRARFESASTGQLNVFKSRGKEGRLYINIDKLKAMAARVSRHRTAPRIQR